MKKVLIITYYWPPAGGPGVQRWLKFVKYLRDFDIEPVVYAPENPSYPLVDPEFEKEIPENVQVIKKSIFEPYALASIFSKKQTKTISSGIIATEKDQNFLQKLMLYIRGNFFIPDARKLWVKPSVKFLRKFLQQENIDTIITTGPPHSLHLIGLNLKENLSITWLADFRDPWTQIGYHSKLRLNKKSQKKHQELEKKVLETADKIIVTSFTTQQEFQKKAIKPVHVITNGFDDFYQYGILKKDKNFTFSHIGSLLSGRNPKVLWQVFSELIREDEEFKKVFQLKLVGAVSETVLKSIKNAGLSAFLKQIDYVKHSEALQLQKQSQVLLLLEINRQETRGIIPGKLFEYLQAKMPILAIGPQSWDAEKILKETNAGKYFDYKNKKELKLHILELFRLFKKNKLEGNGRNIGKFHRKSLTEELAKLLK